MLALAMDAVTPPAPLDMPGAERDALAHELAGLRLVVRAVIACVLGERSDHPDVEDGTHETLRRAMEGRARLTEPSALRPWVVGIARHVALDARRARARARRRHVGLDDAPASPDARPRAEQVADPAPGPWDRAVTAERARLLERALSGLPRGPRDALLLFHVEGLGYSEIAARLGVPAGTVATWMARGRRALLLAVGDVDLEAR